MTGVLPVALMEARRVIQPLLLAGKEYIGVMRLHSEVPEKLLRIIFEEFEGRIYQRPPLRSSVKRVVRIRTIYQLNLLEVEGRDVLFQVACQAGTYIRKLCHDMGEALGCGGHMRELRRVRAGPLTEDRGSVTLHDIVYFNSRWKEEGDEEALRRFIIPMERALEFTPKIYIRDSAVDAICHGANLTAPGIVSLETGIEKGDQVAIMSLKGEAVALAEALSSSEDMLKLNRGFFAKTVRVLMPRGVYPRMWRSR